MRWLECVLLGVSPCESPTWDLDGLHRWCRCGSDTCTMASVNTNGRSQRKRRLYISNSLAELTRCAAKRTSARLQSTSHEPQAPLQLTSALGGSDDTGTVRGLNILDRGPTAPESLMYEFAMEYESRYGVWNIGPGPPSGDTSYEPIWLIVVQHQSHGYMP
jgi:hypothetical protein